jgi:2Fe-2S ferredoxin
MPVVTYVQHDGEERRIEMAAGESLMQGALSNGVQGIVGECGGGLACATCHCYIDEAWIDRVGEPSDVERQMLECVTAEMRPGSRLGCQVAVSDDLNGLVVRLPESQF